MSPQCTTHGARVQIMRETDGSPLRVCIDCGYIVDPAQRPATGLQWGHCVDCGARLWVSPTSTDTHCTPCHMRRLFGGPPPVAGGSEPLTMMLERPTAPARKPPAIKAAIALERTADSKLAACTLDAPCGKSPCPHRLWLAVTHAAKVTCPPSCIFFDSKLCYADHGPQAWTTGRLNRNAETLGSSALDVAMQEAAEIDRLTGRHVMRLHIVGDCATDECAEWVSAAAERYSTRHGQLVWTYTHGWRETARASWRNVSVLASCETDDDVRLATSRGYAVALVRSHEGLPRDIDGIKLVPCLQQTGKSPDCARCTPNGPMCAMGPKLVGNACIVFDPHGAVQLIQEALEQRRAATR